MGEAAVRYAKEAGYVNAGTVEFLVDRNRDFYFMEMNARIQADHPVTDLVTGIDLVKTQIAVAMGQELPFRQEDIKPRGHAIEVRVNAEDPAQGFRPSPGKVGMYVPPGGMGVRVASHLFPGYRIPPNSDSLIAKVLVHRADREEAIATMLRALREMIVEGVKTTIPLLLRILAHDRFRSGSIDTGFLDANLASLVDSPSAND